jgi:hypothetical protein
LHGKCRPTDSKSNRGEECWDQAWGDKLKNNNKANKSLMRIILWNCGGFPNDSVNPKNQLIQNALLDAQANISLH